MKLNVSIKDVVNEISGWNLSFQISITPDKDMLAVQYIRIEQAIDKAMACGTCTGASGYITRVDKNSVICNNVPLNNLDLEVAEARGFFTIDHIGRKFVDIKKWYKDYFIPRLIKQALMDEDIELEISY